MHGAEGATRGVDSQARGYRELGVRLIWRGRAAQGPHPADCVIDGEERGVDLLLLWGAYGLRVRPAGRTAARAKSFRARPAGGPLDAGVLSRYDRAPAY